MSWAIAVEGRVGALDLDVRIEGGDRPVALIGPNGSGKTTLLRTIAGAHRPHSGVIRIDGEIVFDSTTGIDVVPEERRVGYVPQGYGLFPHLDVLDNVAFGIEVEGRRRRRARRRAVAGEQLAALDAGHLAHRAPTDLSGGEQQRVALARALVREPRILLLDEPLGALDALARRSIRAVLANHLARFARPALVVSHEARDVHDLDATVHVLEDGRIVQSGPVDDVAAEPRTDFVRAFFES